MPKYIERETLLKHAIALNNPHELGENVVPVSDIEAAPAADVAEVVHGRWIDSGENDADGNGKFRCSVCGSQDRHVRDIEVPHCWFCGAKMDLEADVDV